MSSAMEFDRQVYCAVYGSMITRQVMDRMAEGRGAPTDEDMEHFVEEAKAVAFMTLQTAERRRRQSEICEWCNEPVANGETHGEGRCFVFDDSASPGCDPGVTRGDSGVDGPQGQEP